MNPNYSHIYDRFVGDQLPEDFVANSSHESIADAVAEYIRDMIAGVGAVWTEGEDMEEVADALVSYITDALTVTASYAYVDSETRTERMGTWTGLRRSAIEAAIQHLGWEDGSYYADELGQHIEADEDDLVELGAGLIAAGRERCRLSDRRGGGVVIVRRLVFEDTAQTFRVVLSDEVVKHMFRLCDANRAQETGGILIGSYSHDYTTAQIVEATSPPADSKFGRDWFHRGTDGLKELLIARWSNEPRTHYVGEWHSHTANVPWPSPQDKKQMREVARDSRYDCAQPLLIIVCPVREGQWVVKCFVFPGGTSPEALRMVDDPEFDEPEPDDAKCSREEQ